MFKIINFLYFLIFLFFCQNSIAYQNKDSSIKLKNCNRTLSDKEFQDFKKKKIEKINIQVNNYREWTKNNLKILVNKKNVIIPDNLKKKFNAELTIYYQNNLKCNLKATIRQHGDLTDHINLYGNAIVQSLDIELKDGNIKNFIKFKLFKNDTRGVLNDEIFMNELLRLMGFLAPRSYLVYVSINDNIPVQMILQEKIVKEMLEFNYRREGPIFETDERFVWEKIKKIKPELRRDLNLQHIYANNALLHTFARQTNAKILNKNDEIKKLSINSLSNLNKIFLHRINEQGSDKNYELYHLNNYFLGLFDEDKILILDIFSLLMYAANGNHGLEINNRNFYFNAFENYYEPIAYDHNFDLTLKPKTIKSPGLKYQDQADIKLRNLIQSIDETDLLNKLLETNLNISEKELKKKLNQLLINLDYIKNNKENYKFKTENEKQNFLNFSTNNMKIFIEKKNETNTNIHLIKFDDEGFYVCEAFLNMDCSKIHLSQEEIIKIVTGRYEKNKIKYQFIGNDKVDFHNYGEKKGYKKIYYKNNLIIIEEGIDFFITDKKIEFIQKIIGAKAFIIGGELNEIELNFFGLINSQDLKLYPKNPQSITTSTGCLGIINSKLNKVVINVKDSTCEDGINLVNVHGQINSIIVDRAISDAIDFDFSSNLTINEIKVSEAKNDCVDVSYGKFTFLSIETTNCGDKTLSVGENSLVNVKKIHNSQKSKVGIATKDSSFAKIENAFFNSVDTCLEAYQKKPEFNGGYLSVNNMVCNKFKKKIQTDNYSKIIVRYDF